MKSAYKLVLKKLNKQLKLDKKKDTKKVEHENGDE
jgi:hypothetical protein